MDKCKFLIMVLSLNLFLAPRAQAQLKAQSGTQKANTPTITVTGLEVTDKTLMLRYEIKNGSGHDIWVCEDIDVDYESDFEVRMAKDTQTLLIRRRLDVPMNRFRNHPRGRYVRLRTGESRMESLLLPFPIRPRCVFFRIRQRKSQGTEHARRLAMEIGFYPGDLYGTVLGMLEEAEKTPRRKPYKYPTDILDWFGGSPLYFTRGNEGLRDRDEQVKIPYTRQTLKGEQVLRTTVGDLLIPYENETIWPGPSSPDLSRCTRVEIRYKPSILEYFFPYAGQQSLLDAAETKYLQSQNTVFVNDQERLKAFADEISKGLDGGAIITERSTAQVVCFREDELLTSFTAYHEAIETEEKQRFRYQNGLQNIIRILTPQIKPFELRIRCAINLKNLWNRLRLYQKADKRRRRSPSARSRIVYPNPAVWCYALVEAYQNTGPKYSIMRAHKCPSAGEGKCHYAMNLNCEPNSLPDTVLLFETRAGWNQHGGPELFTFDNHDPKGGCVLLNDGTVKFIRTKEELQKLRWK